MIALKQLQLRFQDAIVADTRDFAAHIVATQRVDAARRIDIYADAYRARLVEGLRDNFDALHKLLGDDDFLSLGLAFIDAYPSGHFSIRWYGRELPDFLRGAAPYRDYPYLAELAEFQWYMRSAFDAPDAAPLAAEAMSAIAPGDWPGMRLAFHPSLSVARFAWDVPRIWKQLDGGDGKAVDEPQRTPSGIDWIIWRRGLDNYFRSAQADEAAALRAALANRTFAQVCELLCDYHDEDQVARYAAGLLKRWLEDGMVTGIIGADPA